MSTPTPAHTALPIKTPVAWQKFGKDWCLTGQHGMRPIYLSAGRSGCLQLLDSRNILIPFDPAHPHAQFIETAVNTHQALVEALREVCTHAETAWRVNGDDPPCPWTEKARALIASLTS